MTYDDLHKALLEMHQGLDAQQRLLMDNRLIHLLAQHIEDDSVIRQAITEVRREASRELGGGGAMMA